MGGKPSVPVLFLVEDNDDHAELLMRALRRTSMPCEVRRVADGEAALSYLLRRPPFDDPASCPRPDVVLLDLRLPKVDGLEVLRQVKESASLRGLPVVILSTSDAERDLAEAYARHANAYLVKPPDATTLAQLLADLEAFWLSWNRRPRSGLA